MRGVGSVGRGILGLALLLLLLALAAVEGGIQDTLVSVDGSGTSNPGPFMWKVGDGMDGCVGDP